MKTLVLAAVALAATGLVAAVSPQQGAAHDPDRHVKGGGPLPAGWQVRFDAAGATPEAVSFVAMGTGFHARTGPAAVFYRPDWTRSGRYTFEATFQQMEASAHPEAYGLVIGGADLAGANQKYTYFLIRQDGQFLVKRRAGARTPTITNWTAHQAIGKTEGTVRSANTLAIAVDADKVRFLVNGTEVSSAAPSQVDASGIVGLRINHNLNVHIDKVSLK